MKIVKLSVYLLLASLHVAVLGLGLMIYTSMFEWAPWFEPCGLQIFAIFSRVVPALCLLGLLVILLGFILPLSIQTRASAFLGAGMLSLPIGIADGFGGTLWRVREDSCWKLGVLLSIALVVWILCLAVRDVKHILKEKKKAPTTGSRLS